MIDLEPLTTVGKPAKVNELALVLDRATSARDGLIVPTLESTAGTKPTNDILDDIAIGGAWLMTARDTSHRLQAFGLGYPSNNAGYDELFGEQPDTAQYLSLLMADPEFWGDNTVAKTLIRSTVDYLAEAGSSSLELWTARENNERPRAFYERNGFQLTDLTRTSRSSGRSLVHYRRAL